MSLPFHSPLFLKAVVTCLHFPSCSCAATNDGAQLLCKVRSVSGM